MRLEVCEPTALRLKASRCLALARDAREPCRSDLLRLAEDYARRAFALSRPEREAA